jgi:WD40 repeat protein
VKFALAEVVQSCSAQGIDLSQFVGNVGDVVDEIMGKSLQVVESHERRDAKDFADDETNRRLIGEVLVTKAQSIGATKWQQSRTQLLSHDFETATCVATLAGHSGYAIAFHPTAPLLATGSSDYTAKLWRFSPDGSTATCVATLEGHGNWVNSVAFHPTAPLLATGFEDKTAKFWR